MTHDVDTLCLRKLLEWFFETSSSVWARPLRIIKLPQQKLRSKKAAWDTAGRLPLLFDIVIVEESYCWAPWIS